MASARGQGGGERLDVLLDRMGRTGGDVGEDEDLRIVCEHRPRGIQGCLDRVRVVVDLANTVPDRLLVLLDRQARPAVPTSSTAALVIAMFSSNERRDPSSMNELKPTSSPFWR